jgi:hypothetical protein
MSTHAPPDESHRRHWYPNDIGVDPDHDPLDTDNDCPDCAVPDTTGNTVFDGGVGAEATTAVAAESAVADPDAFVAVTRARIVEPTSPLTRTYDAPVAPAMSTQADPSASQRRHWRVYVIGVIPVQIPSVVVSVCPLTALPDTTGGDVLAGGAGAETTTGVAAESAELDETVLVAVTRTRIVEPTSTATSVYDDSVAPGMSTQPAPPVSQRRH